MCAQFSILPQGEAELILLEAENRGKLKDPAFSLHRKQLRPGDQAAVLCKSRASGQRMAYPMYWGFRTDHGLVFNARSETCSVKPLFRDSFANRRCLIPMSLYYEWDHRTKPMIKYGFRPEDRSQLCCFAGLYRTEETGFSFTVLTRDPSPELAVFHDRMPVILTGETADLWLFGDASQAMDAVDRSLIRLVYGAVA